MEQLERPPEEVWDERRLWFEGQEALYSRAGARAPSEQACALMIDLQAVFCAGAWAAVVILACAVTEAQGGSKRESLPGVPDREYRWLRAMRNRLSHENRNDPEITVEDQWLRRDLWEERARRAVAIAFAALYPAGGGKDRASDGGHAMTTVRVVVSGRVQGVWFRAWTEKTAKAHGLDGWVRNRRDGTVEAVLSGDAATVEEMIERLWEGPDLAAVKAVDRFDHSEPVGPGFEVRPTA